MEQTSPAAFTVAQSCARSGLSRSTLYAAMSTGALRSFKVGKRRMIRCEALADWLTDLERQQTEAGPGLKMPARARFVG